MSDDRDRRKPGRLPTAAGPLLDDIDPEEITGRMTLVDNPVIRAALLRLQERADEIARELREETAVGQGQMRARIHTLANELQKVFLQYHSLQVDLTGSTGNNGRIGKITERVEEVRSTVKSVGEDVGKLKTVQLDHARSIDEAADGRKAVRNWLLGVVGAAVLSLATAVVAVYQSGYKKSGEDTQVRQLQELTHDLRVRQEQILTALWRTGIFTPTPPSPVTLTPGDPP